MFGLRNGDNITPPTYLGQTFQTAHNHYFTTEATELDSETIEDSIRHITHHGYGQASLYMMRKRWDYFVRYLMGAEPPKEYELKQKPDPRMQAR